MAAIKGAIPWWSIPLNWLVGMSVSHPLPFSEFCVCYLFPLRNPILFEAPLFFFIRMARQLVTHGAAQADDLLIDRADWHSTVTFGNLTGSLFFAAILVKCGSSSAPHYAVMPFELL